MAAPMAAPLSLFRRLRQPPPAYALIPLLAPPSSAAALRLHSPLPSSALPLRRRRFDSPPPRSPKPFRIPFSVSFLHTRSGPESQPDFDDDDESLSEIGGDDGVNGESEVRLECFAVNEIPLPESVDWKLPVLAVKGKEEVEASESRHEFDDDDDEIDDEIEDEDGVSGENGVQLEGIVANEKPYLKPSKEKPPILTVKEKKELASYAHSLGKKLKIQQVGKSGVTASMVSSFVETLEANELLKIKIHGNCPGEVVDVVNQLEEATGSVVVGQIGRTVILYRPSLSKLKAEEKKREARRVFVRREFKAKPLLLQKARAANVSGSRHRGSSRF